jgi:hypothetical protein
MLLPVIGQAVHGVECADHLLDIVDGIAQGNANG